MSIEDRSQTRPAIEQGTSASRSVEIRHVFGTTFSHVIRSRRSTPNCWQISGRSWRGSAFLAPDGDFFLKRGSLLAISSPDGRPWQPP